MAHDDAFLGTGWSFPPTFDRDHGEASMISGEQDIRQSLQVLFSTIKGERVMLPGFGCALDTLVFDDIGPALEMRIRQVLLDAILFYEPRIEVGAADIAIEADPDEHGTLRVRLSFRVRQTNTRSNMVFPFYYIEGNNVRQIGVG